VGPIRVDIPNADTPARDRELAAIATSNASVVELLERMVQQAEQRERDALEAARRSDKRGRLATVVGVIGLLLAAAGVLIAIVH